MTRKTLVLLIISIFFWITTPIALADVGGGAGVDAEKLDSIFGKIQPPPAIQRFLDTDPTGAAGISKFLSNFIVLIYTVAAIVLVFMLLWGAFDWMISEGNKEKLQAAQNKIINAVIGLILFAVAFAIIRILGQFTGFTFFSGQ